VLSDSRYETASLRTEIQSLQHAVSERNDALTSKDAQISQLQSAIATLDATTADQRANLEDLQRNLASSHAEIEEQNLMISHLERTAEEVISERASITAEMSDIFTSNESLTGKLQEAEATNVALWEQLAAEVEKTLQAHGALTEARTARVAVKAKARIMDDAMIQAKSNELRLKGSLSDEEAKSHALRCKVDTLESVVKTLNGSLEATRIADGELKEQLSASVERGHKLSQALEERDEMIVQLSNLKEEALEQISALSREASSHKEDLSRLHSALETIDLQLRTTKEDAARLTLELRVKERERDECAAEVSRIDAVRLCLSAQIEDDQKTIGELRVETHAAQGTINVLHETIEEYRSKQAAVALAKEMDVSSLKSSLASMEIEGANARSQLASLQTSRDDIVQHLQSTTVELDDARAALEAEINRAFILESDVRGALRRAREAEEKVVYLKQSGDANEATIKNLKAGYASFREAQMDALMELDGKVLVLTLIT
jgi:chromosome segregation ATPase